MLNRLSVIKYDWVSLLFLCNHFLDTRAEIKEFFSLDFVRIVDTIISFWNFLTFRCDVTPHQTKVDKLFRTTTLCMSCRTSGPDDMYRVIGLVLRHFRLLVWPQFWILCQLIKLVAVLSSGNLCLINHLILFWPHAASTASDVQTFFWYYSKAIFNFFFNYAFLFILVDPKFKKEESEMSQNESDEPVHMLYK